MQQSFQVRAFGGWWRFNLNDSSIFQTDANAVMVKPAVMSDSFQQLIRLNDECKKIGVSVRSVIRYFNGSSIRKMNARHDAMRLEYGPIEFQRLTHPKDGCKRSMSFSGPPETICFNDSSARKANARWD